MSNLDETELKFRLVREQLDDGSYNEPYIEVEVGNGEAFIRGTDAEQLMMNVLESARNENSHQQER